MWLDRTECVEMKCIIHIATHLVILIGTSSKSQRLRLLRSDWDEIEKDHSSRKCTLIEWDF